MSTEQVTLYDLNREFTGRDTPRFPGGYDPTRMYRLHRRNRAEVWTREHRAKLLDSIRHRRYIPPIITHEVIENGRVHRDILDGGNRTSAVRRILDGGEFELTDDDRRAIERYTIPVVVLRHLTPQEIRIQFTLLNKVVRVSHGQLYHMSAEDSPLVAYAYDVMTNPDNALRPRILDLFTSSVLSDNASKGNLANMVALIASAQHGVSHTTCSFDRNEQILGLPINRELIETRLGLAFSAFTRANARMPADWVRDGRVSRGDFNVGRYLGAILYDLLPHGQPGTAGYEPSPTDTDPVIDKWAQVILDIRNNNGIAAAAISVPGANNLTPRKLRRMSRQTDFYIANGRLPNEQEMAAILEIGHAVEADDDDDTTEEDADD